QAKKKQELEKIERENANQNQGKKSNQAQLNKEMEALSQLIRIFSSGRTRSINEPENQVNKEKGVNIATGEKNIQEKQSHKEEQNTQEVKKEKDNGISY
ncbi:MAG: hypothetical protein ACKO1F_16025, partial [Flammeovirgaceae bacterium]